MHTYAQDDLSDVNRAGEILLRLVREYRIEHSGLGFEEALHEVMSRPANQHLVKVYNAVAE
ncbi:MAG: hypothetical protein HY613_02460 [Candidatus Rokubacteria bacterium]|nr:hypothetical protein [Candidatus Rokubacteria bacterium]